MSRCDERSTSWQPFVLIGASTVALLVLVTSPCHLTDWVLTAQPRRGAGGHDGEGE